MNSDLNGLKIISSILTSHRGLHRTLNIYILTTYILKNFMVMRFYKLYLLGSNKVYFMCKLYVASNCNGVGYDYSFNDFLTVWYFTLYRICMDTIVSMVQRTANVFVILKGAMKNVPNLLHTTYQFGFIHLLFNNTLSGHYIFRLLNDHT